MSQGRAWRRVTAALLLTGMLAVPGCVRDPVIDTGEQSLRARFPSMAAQVLDHRDSFTHTTHGLTTGGHRFTRPGGLSAVFPLNAEGAVRFALADGFAIHVTELGARGTTARVGGAIAFVREGGRSYWTTTENGFEEWLHLGRGEANGNVVARWNVRGARLVQRGEAVELIDEHGATRLRVTAPVAFAIDGGPVTLKLFAQGQQLALWVDARGEEVLVDPAWEPAGGMLSARAWHAATLLHSGKVLVTGGSGAQKTAELYDPATGTWSSTGAMTVGREMHSQVVLRNGKVLVCGGQGTATLSSCELYDPATGVWTTVANMAQTRQGHIAVLLKDGRVLVSGGYASQTGSKADSSSEVYDPASNTWSFSRSMKVVRTSHAGVLLPDGRVLISGGTSAGAAAEIYDPAVHAWSLTTSMLGDRFDHALVLLSDGRALASGGRSNSINLATAELYDPATGAWTATGPLQKDRRRHTTTLLPNGKVVAIAGESALSLAEVFDPATGTWAAGGTLSVGRQRHMATLLPSGKVLITGGQGLSGQILASSELYDATVVERSAAAAGTERMDHTTTLLRDGTVLVAGGQASGAPTASAQLYDWASNAWTSAGTMIVARADHASALLLDGDVLVVGGRNTGTLSSAERFDSASRSWSAVGALASARANLTATLLGDGTVLVAGGTTGTGALATAEVFSPASNTWSETGTMVTPRFGHIAVRLDGGRVLVAGGSDGTTVLASAELFDPVQGTWSSAGTLSTGRQFATATLLPSGQVAIIGGEDPLGPQGTIDVFDPITRSWASKGTLKHPRSHHCATLLPGGKVLISGGSSSTALAETELWDPETRTLEDGPLLTVARAHHGATRLPNGHALIVGGETAAGAPTGTSEFVFENRGSSASVTPTLTAVPSVAAPGSALSLTGTGFHGTSTASGGFLSSASNHPLFVLTREGGEGAWFLPVADWTATSANVVVPSTIGGGHHWLSVIVNGVRSTAQGIVITSGSTTANTLAFVTPPQTLDTNTCSALVRVQLQDGLGNPVAVSDSTQVLLSSSVPSTSFFTDASCTSAATSIILPAGGSEVGFHFRDSQPGTPTLVATANDAAIGSAAQQQSIVTAAASSLTLTGYPSPVSSGMPGTFTVTARDAAGNVATNYAGTVTFSSTDSAAQLPAPFTFTTAESGTKSFTATFATPGLHTLTVTDSSASPLVASQSNIEVTHAQGTACTSDAQCATGLCVDGVCCDATCSDACRACNVAGLEGTCSPVADGTTCADSEFCNGVETCSAGVCADGPDPACQDPSGVLVLTCSSELQACVEVPMPPVIAQDAALVAAVGHPYPYNATGALTVSGTRPMVFSTCGAPDGFRVDAATGAISWTPQQAGLISVCVSAANGLGVDTYAFVVDVAEAVPGAGPVAAFVVDPASGPAPFRGFFNASASTADPATGLIGWTFDFGEFSALANGKQVTSNILLPGGYQPKLEVTDAYGRTATTTRDLLVLDTNARRPPLARIMTTSTSGDGNLSTTLSCDCTEGDAPIVAYEWDYGTGRAAGASPTLELPPGRYRVRLTAVDASGLTGRDSVDLVVSSAGVQPPECRVWLTPPAGPAPLQVTHEVSTGPALSIPHVLTFSDGSTSTEALDVRTYDAPGRYAIAVSAKDENGLPCVSRVEVVVTHPDGTMPPVIPVDTTSFDVTLRREGEGSPAMWSEVELTANVSAVQAVAWELVWLKVDLKGPARFLAAEPPDASDTLRQLHRIAPVDASSGALRFPVLVAGEQDGPVTITVTLVDESGASLSKPSAPVTFTPGPMQLAYGCHCNAAPGGGPWALLLLALALLTRSVQRNRLK